MLLCAHHFSETCFGLFNCFSWCLNFMSYKGISCLFLVLSMFVPENLATKADQQEKMH